MALSSQAREYLRKAEVFFERGVLKNARDNYRRAKKIAPESDEIKEFGNKLKVALNEKEEELRKRIEFYLQAKNIEEAEKKVRELLVLSSDNSFARQKLEHINSVKEKVQEYKNKGITVVPGMGRSYDVEFYSAVSLLARAQGHFDNGKREKALELVNQVLEREPGLKAALKLKKEIQQINELQRVVKTASDAFKEGEMRRAVIALNNLVNRFPGKGEYLLLRARAYIKLEKYKEAEKDLWKYYRNFETKPEVIYPLMAEIYYGLGKYGLALGFCSHGDEIFKDRGFRFSCYVNFYRFEFSLLVVLSIVLTFSFYFAYRNFESLTSRFPPGEFTSGLKLAWAFFFKSPESYLPLLVDLARGLNTPWLNYFAAICLFKAEQLDGAQRFFAYSFSNDSVAGRAYYFFGLTRKMLKQRLANHDFEESVLSMLGRPQKGWYPDFVREVERQLIGKFSGHPEKESYEFMALELVKEQTGERL
ncbi:MAG: tetratricopeptide repeat protein [Candidatus Rifleibacteriota bacterium]